jgi:hypothetical protein
MGVLARLGLTSGRLQTEPLVASPYDRQDGQGQDDHERLAHYLTGEKFETAERY